MHNGAMRYLLIDGKNMLFRAGFAGRHLKTEDGRYSGAVFGFVNMLCRVRGDYPDVELVILWEQAGQRTRRHRIFPGYKQRSSTDEDGVKAIHDQMPAVKDICAALALRWVEVAGQEADDLAGLLSTALPLFGHEVLLFSGDKDWWQLASRKNVTVICEQGVGRDDPILTDAHVHLEFGCKAKELVRLRPFIGDTSDKIPPAKPRLRKKLALALMHAGADPRKPLSEQPEAVRNTKGIAEIWAGYVRNYQLMTLPKRCSDCELTEEKATELLNAVLHAELKPNRRQMYRLFTEWELSDAMRRSDFVFSIARPQR